MSEIESKSGMEVILVPSNEIPVDRVYSNYVEIGQSPYDFTLKFCDATAIKNIDELEKNEGKHFIPVVANIAIPFRVVPSLIKALESQYKIYQDAIKGNNDGDDN